MKIFTYLIFAFILTLNEGLDKTIISSILDGYPAYVYENNTTYSKENSIIINSKGKDTISSIASSIILGNKGDDIIHSSQFNDVFVYRKGDGSDIIFDENGNDSIYFSDINKDEISLSKDIFDLIIKVKDTQSDSITIKDFFKEKNQIENILFADDTKLDYAVDLLPLLATSDNDYIELTNDDNTFDALAGNDTVYGLGGNDTLTDGEGNDTLFGNEGNDTLISTSGDNTLYGGTGDDTYVYKNTSGKVIIKDVGGSNDTLELADVSSIDNIFSRTHD